MKNLTATYKGLITGLLMVGISIAIFYLYGDFDSPLQYLVYALYIAGVIWTLRAFHHSDADNKSFKNYFTEGFKFFIVVSFLMVLFTFVFTKLDSSMREQMAVTYRQDLEAKGNYTATEVNEKVQGAKDYFAVMLTSSAIFGYLVIGSMATVVTTLFFLRRKA